MTALIGAAISASMIVPLNSSEYTDAVKAAAISIDGKLRYWILAYFAKLLSASSIEMLSSLSFLENELIISIL